MGANKRWAFFSISFFLISAFAVLPTTAENLPPAETDSIVTKIANRYGAPAFSKVEDIHFVFNVTHDGKPMRREWTWWPKIDSVYFVGQDPKGAPISAGYSRRNPYSMKSENVVAIDKSFINDEYWLLFPLHLMWDNGMKFKATAMPVSGKDRADANPEKFEVTVTYPLQGGYTPGDAYDLFVDSTWTIRRWIFRKSNSEKPTMEAMWAPPTEIGGLWISLERPGAKPGFKVWFTDVKVITK